MISEKPTLTALILTALSLQATATPAVSSAHANASRETRILLVQEDPRRIPDERFRRGEVSQTDNVQRSQVLQRSRELERRNETGAGGGGGETDAASKSIRQGAKYSGGYPPVDLSHVFQGEVSRKNGKDAAKGFHHAPGDELYTNVTIVQILKPPNAQGIYTAKIEVTDPKTGSTYIKDRSTMFPDSMTRDDVVKSLQNAYSNATTRSGNFFKGPSGYGFDVVGFTDGTGTDFHIKTGYPD